MPLNTRDGVAEAPIAPLLPLLELTREEKVTWQGRFRPALREQGAGDILVIAGGVIPQQDYEFLYEAGVKGIYGPGTPIPASAKDVLEQIRKAIGKR